jgi:hypothetical protein
MELALVASALFGAGIVYSRRQPAQAHTPAVMATPSTMHTTPTPADGVGGHPSANSRQTTNVHIDARSAAMMPSGRRDNSLFVDKSSINAERHDRYYSRPPPNTKREVEATIDSSTRQENVFVRSNTGYVTKYKAELDRPTRMHNVNPIATTSGTASQLVGPGLNTNREDMTGREGLHYGMVRMKPNDVHNHFREQKGAIIPGKNLVNARTSAANLGERGVSNATFGESGYVGGDPNQPVRTFGISEAYQTSAPGRATVTGAPGYGGRRLEPSERPTNRDMGSSPQGPAGVHGGISAPRDRDEYSRSALLQTERGTRNEFVGVAQGSSAPGYQSVVDAFEMAKNERSTTECARAEHISNLANPGQQATLVNTQPTQTTQRQASRAPDTANLAPQFPGAAARPDQQVRPTQRLENEYRAGPAQLASVPSASGQGQQTDAFADSRLAARTQRESIEANEFQGALKSVGVNAPMSYTNVLESEGYSNRSVPQPGYVPGSGNMNVQAGKTALGVLDEKPPELNAGRNAGGGVGNQQHTNFYVRNDALDSAPNRAAVWNQRLDPRVLDALTRNELALAQAQAA